MQEGEASLIAHLERAEARYGILPPMWYVSREQHIVHAAVVWVLVGCMITARGTVWVLADLHTHAWLAVILPLAALLGVGKGVWVLGRSAGRSVARIRALDARTPWWRMYSPAMYLLIAGMMALGIALRWAGAHWHLVGAVGILYLVIGIALLAGSGAYWKARGAEVSPGML